MAEIKTFAKPIWLYRYRSLGHDLPEPAASKKFDREMDALLNNQIFCGRFDSLNDPMEGVYEASAKATAQSNFRAIARLITSEKLGIGIGSFSETWDNTIMWAHYADHFYGICVCYGMTGLLGGMPDDHFFARMAYGDKLPLLNLPSAKDPEERTLAILSRKHLSWQYEREWRLFAPTVGLANHNANAIKSVYLGPRMSKEKQARVRAVLKPLGIPVHTTRADGYSLTKVIRRVTQRK